MSVASGPSISVPNDTIRVFATSGTFTPAFTGTVEVLVVGGGGGGGGGIGGGGGAGGVVYMPAVSVTSGTAYTITVGGGGAATLYPTTSASGGDSTAFGATAKGGGGSGVHDSGAGVAGGSGGGAASNNSVLNQGGASSGNSLGTNTGTIYGNRGGNMTTARVGGPTAAAGGGGAGAAAADTNSNNVQTSPGAANGRGGAGVANSILGTLYYWAGGGGGGAYFNGYAGDGGIGGGGGGSCSGGAGPTRGGGNGLNSGIGAAIDTNGAAGAMNTGSGGGGGAWQVTFGGAGGSGIVIVRYSASLGESTGGAPISVGDIVVCLDAGNPLSYPGTGTAWRDVSGGSNNGTLYNGPTFSNGVISFDGIDDYMQANINSTLLDGDPTFSVDMFVRRRTGTNIGGNAGFWGIGGAGQGNSAEGWTPTPNVIHLDIYDSTRLESAATYPEGSFVHIVWTKNGPGVETTNTKCYVNGVEVTLTKTRNATRTNQFNTSTPGAGICLGRINGDAAGLNAPIDVGVFKVYSSALTAAQVLQNFNALRGRYGI